MSFLFKLFLVCFLSTLIPQRLLASDLVKGKVYFCAGGPKKCYFKPDQFEDFFPHTKNKFTFNESEDLTYRFYVDEPFQTNQLTIKLYKSNTLYQEKTKSGFNKDWVSSFDGINSSLGHIGKALPKGNYQLVIEKIINNHSQVIAKGEFIVY